MAAPPRKIVFNNCTADDVIAKLTGLGCCVKRSNKRGVLGPRRRNPNSELVTQTIYVTLDGFEPFGEEYSGSFLAWKLDETECHFVYLQNNPVDNPNVQKMFDAISSDPSFVRHNYTSMDEYKSSRDAV